MKLETSPSRRKQTSSFISPSFAEERLFEAQGYRYVAGIDEVGRGALAGPVVAAAVILPLDMDTPWLEQVRDSKQLTAVRREELFDHIRRAAISVGIGMADCDIVDNLGIVPATRLAMRLALRQLSPPITAPISLLSLR